MRTTGWAMGCVTAVLGLVIGFVVGAKYGEREQLSDSYLGTAGHTRTYVSIARHLRKEEKGEALKLLDAMINFGESRLADPLPSLDSGAFAYVDETATVLREYRRDFPKDGTR